LATEAEGFSDQLSLRSPRWQQVQRRLQPGEAAIEWVRFPWRHQAYLTDSAFYAAYIIRPEAAHPEVVYLPTLASTLETDYYGAYANSIRYKLTDQLSYGAFWEPLAEALSGVKKVYVANDGILHLVNLATLYNPATDQYLGQNLEIQYVTSTGNLTEEKPDRLLRRAMLLGRPAYSVEDENRQTTDSAQERFFVANFQELEITDLPGTEDEVSSIEQKLKEQGIVVDLYLGADASEDVLQAAEHPSILHIATHGYWNTLDYEATEGYRTFNAMINSGLLLSGVVNYYQSQDRPYTYDGVLTAYEAQNLDLEGTDLVVLSACETGLGLFDAGEGVYGLQRAFRAAGAQSTLTSLWKVDDQATQQFMTAFYDYYLQGQSKFEAHRSAQKDIRDLYGSPYYWGAFILNGE
ncbi:MAG TPA: hypothetical protein DCP28_04050, partial [Cytophagales bacterium]|nr:hypothetical protein [Cytophagales bacterium]